MKRLLFGLAFLFFSTLAAAASPVQRLSQMIDYIAVDYPGAVVDGRIENETEYREMLDFARNVRQLTAQLPQGDRKPDLVQAARQLQTLIEQRADRDAISRLSAQMRGWLIDAYELPAAPARAPDPALGQQLYARYCAACHGSQGRGDGPEATGMQPPPIDFTDEARHRSRTLYGLYGVITQGVEGTAMRGYPELTDEQRWALAFHVGAMGAPPGLLAAGQQRLLDGQAELAAFDLKTLTTRSPAEVEQESDAGTAAVFAWLRAHPDALFEQARGNPLTLARERLAQSLAAYRKGDEQQAHEMAVSAYLDGFEAIEGNLDAIDHDLRLRIESAMTGLRESIRQAVAVEELEKQIRQTGELLDVAAQRLSSTRLSAVTAFAGALLILLREGLEAILVIAALAAFLIKTGRRDGLRWLGLGVFAAMTLGGLTWWASGFIEIGGAGRELTEGLAALFAAAMLFYVGFWLHSKTGAAQWQSFIHDSVRKALGKGALWGLSSLAFIAVYREIFESVLFYQALWLQTGADGRNAIVLGLLVASALLLALAWLILRYSTRLPLRRFFAVTAWFMFILAVVFAGKGVAALQEAGKLPIDSISFPRIDLLGIYPTLQSLGLQLLMLLIALWLLWRSGSRRDATGQ
jgi:high-affinity iron transporter